MIRPIRSQVLVKPFAPDEVSEGGIFIPENARKVSNKVLIVAVGNGVKDKPMRLKSGMIGYRVKDWGMDVMVDGELHFIMDQEAIIATN